MKLTIPRDALHAGLARVKALCSGASSLPILGCVLLEAKNNCLTIIGNNLDLALELTLPCNVEKAGEVCVSAARLTGAVGRMEAEDVIIRVEKKGEELHCEGGDMRVTLFALPVEEFPALPKLSGEGKPVVLASGVLANALARVLPFVSSDGSRHMLCGVYFCAADAQLRLVGTDGRRLICCELGVEAAQSVIVPRAAAKLLLELDTAGEVTLRMGDTLIEATGANWRLLGKLVEGNYPSWRQVVPPKDDGVQRVTVEREGLLKALPFVSAVLSAKSDAVKLQSADGELSVTTLAPEVGAAAVTLEAETKGDVKVAYNACFLADVLRVMTGERVTLEMKDAMSPTRVDEPGTTAVLMPMRIA